MTQEERERLLRIVARVVSMRNEKHQRIAFFGVDQPLVDELCEAIIFLNDEIGNSL